MFVKTLFLDKTCNISTSICFGVLFLEETLFIRGEGCIKDEQVEYEKKINLGENNQQKWVVIFSKF